MKHILLLLVIIGSAWSADGPVTSTSQALDLDAWMASIGEGKKFETRSPALLVLKKKVKEAGSAGLPITSKSMKAGELGWEGHLSISMETAEPYLIGIRLPLADFDPENPPFKESAPGNQRICEIDAVLYSNRYDNSNDVGERGITISDVKRLVIGGKQVYPKTAAPPPPPPKFNLRPGLSLTAMAGIYNQETPSGKWDNAVITEAGGSLYLIAVKDQSSKKDAQPFIIQSFRIVPIGNEGHAEFLAKTMAKGLKFPDSGSYTVVLLEGMAEVVCLVVADETQKSLMILGPNEHFSWILSKRKG